MKLFISYARIDKPYCIQIINMLPVHDPWYDQRLQAGQDWWQEIQRRLEWCEGFVYLMSPDSVQSTYCRREFEIAQQLGRPIFPVLIHPDTQLPDFLMDMQYVDFSRGLSGEAVSMLLNAIYAAEKKLQSTKNQIPQAAFNTHSINPPAVDTVSVVSSVTNAMKNEQFDQAVFMLKRAQSTGFASRFVDLDELLSEAEAGLERQTYLREAAREYAQISELVHFERTHTLGCRALVAFLDHFKGYDPNNLISLCDDQRGGSANGSGHSTLSPGWLTPIEPVEAAESADVVSPPAPRETGFTLPLLEWCEIPAGKLDIMEQTEDGQMGMVQYHIDAYKISRYPVTNAQFEVFIADADGYANPRWWDFSPAAAQWREANSQPQPATFGGDSLPRERINWYEAMAFCQWLSARTGLSVTLPNDLQWIRAARGDDQRRYPWGDKFDQELANTRESDVRMTTDVTRYPAAASPFGVCDLSGNCWEWCLDSTNTDAEGSEPTDGKRLVHGGSYISPCARAEILFRYHLAPLTFHTSIGFRLVVNE